MHNSIFYAKMDDHGVRWGDMGQILAQWQHPVGSYEALDVLHWAMHSASYCLVRMAIKIARKVGAFLSVVNFLSCINVDKRPSYGQLNIKPSNTIVLYNIPLTAMDAILATVSDGG